MQLLDRVRFGAGRPVAIVNVHHENKGGDISGAFEAEFDTVVHVGSAGKDRTQLYFRKSRWSSKIHRSRMTLGWVRATEGFGVLESDLDGAAPEARNAEEAGALEWLTEYVTSNPGVVRGKAETAFHEAHATSPPPIEEAAAGETSGEGGDTTTTEWVADTEERPLPDEPDGSRETLDTSELERLRRDLVKPETRSHGDHDEAARLAFIDTLALAELEEAS
jgi:hypothetical protein